MIEKVTYYDIICDRCDKSLTDESEMRYLDKDIALKFAEQSDWIEINGKNYCPDCYELDEETDEYVEKCDKTICCGECKEFLYEDTNGFGICDKNNEVCYCGDKCHITHGKP